MGNKILKKITGLIEKDKDISIVEELTRNGIYFSGKIKVDFLDEILYFDIDIPHNYPLTHPNTDNISIIFRNKSYVGLGHVNLDGSVCFHPDKHEDFDYKFCYELECLKQWIRDYYVLKREDENYTYLIHNTENGRVDKIYFTNTKNSFKKDDFGLFDYAVFSNDKYGDKRIPVRKIFRLGFDSGVNDGWSQSFTQKLKEEKICRKGLYYFLSEEPVRKNVIGRKGIENWDEFADYFSDEFIRYLYKGLKGGFSKNFYIDESSLFLLVGYPIPTEDNYEEHWDMIRISKKSIPIHHRRIEKKDRDHTNKILEHLLRPNKINWGATENIDYTRFFGRGRLNDKFTKSKILIIGCGALGSSLAEVLVRGGVRNLILEDFDWVSGGNLCRANYDLNDMIFRKTERLNLKLQSLSPFLNVNSINFTLNNYKLSEIEEAFESNIDIIFDCSADPEVTYILDQINFSGEVFSLGITNKAEAFVSLTGKNLSRQAKSFFDYLENGSPQFIEGAGCGYPTFEANYNEIIMLLSTGIKVINSNFLAKKPNKSVVINTYHESEFNLVIEEYEYFQCNSISSSIHISKGVLKRIEAITTEHYPREFGGIFIGFKSGLNFIITEILLPDDYKNGKTIFVRHPGNLNEILAEVYSNSNGRIQYLGEWHSHPGGPTTPSSKDKEAMKIIARDNSIKTDTPLLMITLTSNLLPFQTDFYIHSNNRLIKYER